MREYLGAVLRPPQRQSLRVELLLLLHAGLWLLNGQRSTYTHSSHILFYCPLALRRACVFVCVPCLFACVCRL